MLNEVDSTALIAHVEEISLRAWPAIEEEFFDGWRLRFSQGVTKRANSVQPFTGSTHPLGEKVIRSEEWYAARGAPCIFRLTPLSEPGLEPLLIDRGYCEIEPTLVLRRKITAEIQAWAGDRLIVAEPSEWLDAFARVSGSPEGPPPPLLKIIEKGIERRVLALLWSDTLNAPIACGMAVLEGDWVGLYDLVTLETHRRSGVGTELIGSLLSVGARSGSSHAYLQVTQGNVAARSLYEKLRFEPVYRYSYWMGSR